VHEFTIDVVPGSGPGVRVLKLAGPFTLRDVFEFQEIVRAEAAATTLIDLTAVPYMDSASLGSILGFHVSCEREGRKYALVGVSARLHTLFKVSGVDSMLHYASLSDAAGA
jgi:anti-sigma B factor antagonist